MTHSSGRGWHRADIIAALHKKGLSLSGLAREHGFGDSTLRMSLHHPYPRPNTVIADAVGETMHSLWPDWYAPDGTQILTARQSIERARRRRVQNNASVEHPEGNSLTAAVRS